MEMLVPLAYYIGTYRIKLEFDNISFGPREDLIDKAQVTYAENIKVFCKK